MQIQYGAACPQWVKDHVKAAQLLLGNDPIRIGQALAKIPNPFAWAALSYKERLGKTPPTLFKSQNLIVDFGSTEMPWFDVMPNGGTSNRDEYVRGVQCQPMAAPAL